jgi:signal transduction histidine kinase
MTRTFALRGLRGRLLLAVSIAVAAAMAAAVAGFNLLFAHSLSGSADDLVRARAAAALEGIDAKGGRLVVSETPDQASPDTLLWVFTDGRALEAPRAPRSVTLAAQRLAAGPSRLTDVPGAETRLYAAPVVVSGKRLGTVVTGVSLEPYEHTRHAALVWSLALAGALFLVVLVAAHWLLGAALRPVGHMTRSAEDWSEHDLDRRFALGEPYDELTTLAATLDGLLDRLAASLRHEQRFSGEIAHELRTPLSRIRGEAELALRRERTPSQYQQTLEAIMASATQAARAVETLVAIARHESGTALGTCDAEAAARAATDACQLVAAERGLELAVEAPKAPVRAGVELELAERILQPIVENACRYGHRRAVVTVARDYGGVTFTVQDDGPGVEPDERERIFEPATRGSAGAAGSNGAGLGLALARRLARAASGEVIALPGAGGGRFVIRLPAA